MTTHYSTAGLTKLIEAANKACERDGKGKPELVMLSRLPVSQDVNLLRQNSHQALSTTD
jgi:hypothetical protein